MKKKISVLLEQAKDIRSTESKRSLMDGSYLGVNGPKTVKWLTDAYLISGHLPDGHPLKSEMKRLYSHKGMSSTFDNMYAILQSLLDDNSLLDKQVADSAFNRTKMYDVFLSHASADKISYVEDLKQTLDILGIDVFYDKDTIEWGDDWKKKIYEGLDKSEFAIIVISGNFFGREWTEQELQSLLSRQNAEGQKLILPILHGITPNQLMEKYPAVADIQAIDSSNYSNEHIGLLFAKQLIKRYKAL